MARLCHEGLLLQPPAGHARVGSATFECWATEEHTRPMDWGALRTSPAGRPLPPVDHDKSMTALGCVLGFGYALLLIGSWRAGRNFGNRMPEHWKRRLSFGNSGGPITPSKIIKY